MSFSLVFRTDVHLSDKSPASWKASYLEEVLSNLRQVGQIARDHDALAVLDGGDLFHVKSPSKNSHALVRECIRMHSQEYRVPTYTVVGNHDMQYNNVDTLSQQPLGVVLESGAVGLLTERVFESGGIRVRVVGVPFVPDRKIESLLDIQKKPGDDYLVAVVHALAAESPPPIVEEFFGEPVFRYSDLVTENGPSLFCFGHWHKDQGVSVVGGKTFVNPGSLSRGSLSFETLSRTPKAVVFQFGSSLEVKEIPLAVPPPEDVFDMAAKAQKEQDDTKIVNYLKELQARLESSPRGVSLQETLAAMSLTSKVQQEIFRYLEMEGVG